MISPPNSYGPFSTWLRSHGIAASLIVLFCAAYPRVYLAWRVDPSEVVKLIPDAGTYLFPAQSLVEQGAFLNKNGEPEVGRTPGYPAFLAIILFIVSRDLHKALIIQAIILSSEVLVLYLLARRILPSLTAFIGGLLAAFSPWGAMIASVPLTEGLFLLLLSLIFLGIKHLEELRNPVAVVLGGAWVGALTSAAVLVRPVWPLVLLVAGVLFIRCGVWRKRTLVSFTLTTMVICAVTPLVFWKKRNWQERHFDGLSDVSGVAAWEYLASRVRAEVNDQDRFEVLKATELEESSWGLSIQEADNERWRRARVVFYEHPFLTLYCFTRSATEHIIHPSPDVLRPARLNFPGDFLTLGLLWGGLLILAYVGWISASNQDRTEGRVNRTWILTILIICLLLTMMSGMSFGQGARLRTPLELIIPLMAAIGLLRVVHAFKRRYPQLDEYSPKV